MPDDVDVKESVIDIANEITEGVYKDKFLRVRTKDFALEVRNYWRELASSTFDDETGAYVKSVHVERHPEAAFKKLPQYWVGTRHWRAHFIEYGTGPDTKGASPRRLSSAQRRGRIPLTVTRNTPTPEFGFAAKVAFAFGGTDDSGASDVANMDILT